MVSKSRHFEPGPRNTDQGWFNDAEPLRDIEQRSTGFADWAAPVIQYVRAWLEDHDTIRQDQIRAWCSHAGHEPPKDRVNWYGLLSAKLQRMGLVRTSETYTSRVKSRNAAKGFIWRKGPDWGRA